MASFCVTVIVRLALFGSGSVAVWRVGDWGGGDAAQWKNVEHFAALDAACVVTLVVAAHNGVLLVAAH